jgi:uncharacterized protein (TIGR01777 family)
MTVMEAETEANEEVKTRRSLRIVMPGGTGHLGTILAEALHVRGDEVVVVSRTPSLLPWRVAGWEELAAEVDGADVVINLAGRSVDCRYTERHKQEIFDSRVESTRAVGRAIARARRAPRLWLQMSTATIYAHRYDAPNDERTGILGGQDPGAPRTWRFSIDVATAWERAVDEVALPSTRKVKMRSAIVMSPARGTPFSILRTLARLGVGGRAGDGRQFVSWIHHRDFARAVAWLIDHESLEGPVNLAAPHPLPNAAFMRAIREACGVRLGIPAPAWLLEIAAFLHRTETALLLKSRRVVPARLLRSGFTFAFPTWEEAVRDLCHGAGSEW